MWKLLLIVLAGQASKARALEAVMYDCKSANQTGILDFKDECTINTTALIFKEVQYWIYSTKPKPRPVLTTVCTQWIRKRVISTGWLGNTDFPSSLRRTCDVPATYYVDRIFEPSYLAGTSLFLSSIRLSCTSRSTSPRCKIYGNKTSRRHPGTVYG